MRVSISIVTQWFYALQLLLVCVICAIDNSNSHWTNLQISPDTLCSMTYRDFAIKIYEHFNNPLTTNASQKRYFYSPITMLDHKSVDVEFNNVTNQAKLRFSVEMWNDQLQSEVANYLPQIVGHEIKLYQVQVISFDKVLLAATKPSTIYSWSANWHPYQLEKSVWFTLTCLQQKDCNELQKNIHKDPKNFENLKILFSLSSQSTNSKEIVINFKDILFGQMVSKLLQKFSSSPELFLTIEDVNQLLWEITSNVIVETLNDSDVVSPYSESQIFNMMNDVLVSSRTTIFKQNDILWKYVFWNDDDYRPDKTSKRLNEIYKKLDTVNREKMLDSFRNSVVDLSGESLKNENIKLVRVMRDHVEWNGQKFIPKPLLLCKINLGNLRDAHKVQDRRVKVSYSIAALSIPIRFTQFGNVTNPDKWAELKKELKDFKFKHERDLETAYKNLSVLRKELEESVMPDVSFHVSLERSFSNNKEYVPYDYIVLNRGNGLNKTTGIFTAPRAGTYLFTFTAVTNPRENQVVSIKLNGVPRAKIDNVKNSNGNSHWQTNSMSIVLSLYVNDKVAVSLEQGAIRWSSYFCGILVRSNK